MLHVEVYVTEPMPSSLDRQLLILRPTHQSFSTSKVSKHAKLPSLYVLKKISPLTWKVISSGNSDSSSKTQLKLCLLRESPPRLLFLSRSQAAYNYSDSIMIVSRREFTTLDDT